jgi:hypothetical protein
MLFRRSERGIIHAVFGGGLLHLEIGHEVGDQEHALFGHQLGRGIVDQIAVRDLQPSQISLSGGSLEATSQSEIFCMAGCCGRHAPILSAKRSIHIWHPSTEIAWCWLWPNSEQDHEPDQSGHTDAAFSDVGR